MQLNLLRIASLAHGISPQKFLLSFTNTFEGTSFVNQSIANTVQTPQYLSQLFPNLEASSIAAAAAQYAGLGTNIFQANAIMGECELASLQCSSSTLTCTI